MQDWKWCQNKGIKYITIPEWGTKGVQMAFSTRNRGVSTKPYSSLNLALHVGDNNEDVLENRRRLLNIFDLSIDRMVCCEQVHDTKIAIVSEEDAGKGACDLKSALPKTDGMICNIPGIVLATYYADCFPLFFFDPEKRVIAIAHAGWKGTMGKIAEHTIDSMVKHFNCQRKEIRVFIGPGIQECCFIIQDELAERVFRQFEGFDDIIISNNYGHFWSLANTNRQILINCGISKNNITSCNLCTSCNHNLFYSYRKEKGITGRMCGLITLGY